MIRHRSVVFFKRCVMNVLINEQSSISFNVLCLVFADFYHNLILAFLPGYISQKQYFKNFIRLKMGRRFIDMNLKAFQ